MRRFVTPLLTLSLIATTLVLAVAPPTAGAACAGSFTKQLAGTVEGEDGRYVSAQVGIELFDSAGRKLYMDGCVMTAGGYSKTVHTNVKPGSPPCCYILPGTGSTTSPYNGYALSKAWSVSGIPSNAVTAWIEVYPKRAGASPNTDDSRYGRALRRPITLSDTNVGIDLPLRCGLSGNGVNGSTGSIQGKVYDNGVAVRASRVGAWTTDTDNGQRILGWSLDAPTSSSYNVEPLAPGTYSVIVTANGITKQLYNVRVNACQTTQLNLAVRGTAPVPGPVDRPVAGDWDGDGDQEPGTHSPGGTWRLRATSASSAATAATFTFGVGSGDKALTGDWDGDGEDDSAIFRPGGTWFLRSNDSGAITKTFTYGVAAGDVPVVGDWDGDGIDDAGLYRKGGVWYLRSSVTGKTLRTFTFGVGSTDKPVVGDWDGDGDDEPGIFRNGTWYLRRTSSTSSSQMSPFTFGVDPTDLPVVGDWTGDGSDAPGIYRRGTWYLRVGTGVSDPTLTTFTFGH